MSRTDLNVPFDEREDVKRLSGRWDPEKKTWFIPEGIASAPFKKWIPFRNFRASYWFIAQTIGICWKCKEDTLFTSILLPEGHETLEADEDESDEDKPNSDALQAYWLVQKKPAFIFYIDDIPREVLSQLGQVRHYLSRDYSKTTDSRYWMNHCQHCHAKQGDFPLHCEVDSYFAPQEIRHGKNIELYTVKAPFTATCDGISHDHIHVHFGDSGAMTAGEMFPWMKIVR
ncbi:DUF5710 domain-containing protein [Pantoea sp. At-9b]|uniref:DUF5710 domain-containing protein n=1 Tax=Pantoea sp. (strain At-9b) TaxID=592316 RepID=UPI0001B3FDD2|nr:DUF5710 domain-containing protein [Pantoea sp. At-9b]ADU72218.1 DNA primase [Pantoea sp. At-9b]